jgi:hypothetical protein
MPQAAPPQAQQGTPNTQPLVPQHFPAQQPQQHQVPQQHFPASVTTNVMVVTDKGSYGYGTASLVMAVVSMFFFCVPGLPILTSGLALVLGLISVTGKHRDMGMGIAGLIVGAFFLLMGFAVMLSFGAAMSGIEKAIDPAPTPRF